MTAELYKRLWASSFSLVHQNFHDFATSIIFAVHSWEKQRIRRYQGQKKSTLMLPKLFVLTKNHTCCQKKIYVNRREKVKIQKLKEWLICVNLTLSQYRHSTLCKINVKLLQMYRPSFSISSTTLWPQGYFTTEVWTHHIYWEGITF